VLVINFLVESLVFVHFLLEKTLFSRLVCALFCKFHLLLGYDFIEIFNLLLELLDLSIELLFIAEELLYLGALLINCLALIK
jgi:hypothetical protein